MCQDTPDRLLFAVGLGWPMQLLQLSGAFGLRMLEQHGLWDLGKLPFLPLMLLDFTY